MTTSSSPLPPVTVIGGGLSGTEAAWQLAERGIPVRLYEMRPVRSTGAHVSDQLAELVCSNSLGSSLPDRAGGILKAEMDRLGSLLLDCANATAVPAGGCLAVGREAFAEKVTATLEAHPLVEIIREEVTAIPDGPCILASGPLTSPALSEALAKLDGEEHLFFYDAISPIIDVDSIDMDKAFRANRRDTGAEGDYINCALNKDEYEAFIEALVAAERIELEEFEKDIDSGVRAGVHQYFEGCMPVEIMAARGRDTLAYGPMRPVGIDDPRTGRWAHAVVQLRQDNIAGTCYNMVGFQTNLKFPEQKKVFGLIPGLENAEYLRYGQMHRNTFVNAPRLLRPTLQHRTRDDLFFAGQITGVEGYAGNIATGQLAGINMARVLQGDDPWILPRGTMIGSLCHYVTHAPPEDFQPMKANLGLLPELPPVTGEGKKKKRGKRERAALHAERAAAALDAFLGE